MQTNLIDLRTTTLRSEWNQQDLEHLLKNERLLASIDAVLRNPDLERATWSQRIALIFERRLTVAEDYYEGIPHPRDLDLSPLTYGRLATHVVELMQRGEVARDPTWPLRFPELYNYDPDKLPEAE